MIRFIVCFAVALAGASTASAAVLDFDDVVSGGHYDKTQYAGGKTNYRVKDGYGGFNWQNVWVRDDGTGNNVALNGADWNIYKGYTGKATGASFDFDGFDLYAVDGTCIVNVSGYDDAGRQVGTKQIHLSKTPTWFDLDFHGITKLTINPVGFFANVRFDNFTYNSGAATSVPELDPSGGTSALAMLLGGVAIVLSRRRRA